MSMDQRRQYITVYDSDSAAAAEVASSDCVDGYLRLTGARWTVQGSRVVLAYSATLVQEILNGSGSLL